MSESSLTPDQARHDLYELMRRELPFEQKAEQALDLGKTYLGVENGHLTEIDTESDHWLAVASTDPPDGQYPTGLLLELGETYCQYTIEMGQTLALRDAERQDPISDDVFDTQGLHCYHGTPISLDEETYGTVCFVSEDPRDEPFADDKTMFAELIARMLEHELRQKRAEDRLERLDQFAGVLSHDLRNPLSVAQAYTEVLQASEDITGDDAENVELVLDSLARMDDMIGDVLTMARQGRMVEETERVSLADIADTCWERVETEAATLTVESAVAFRADEGRVSRLFENLYRNAVEHGGETVTVRVGQLDEENGFYVEDDGPGIPESERDSVFDSTYSTGEDGIGLGLAIVEGVVSAHGWSIRVVESTDGGARFEVSDVILDASA